MENRKQFLAQIKQVFAPVLKADGFTGSGSTYRRVAGDVIHVVALQGSASGGKCCVCLGIHLSFLPGQGSLTPPDPKMIEESDCEFRTRLALPGQSDAWWPYGATEQEARESAESIRALYQQVGAPFFRRFSTFPDDFIRVTPPMLAVEGELPFPPGCTFVRLALALARIAQRVGRIEDARQFAEVGLARVGPATSLKLAFRQIITAA
ncbi:MAG: hypothetical protein FD161_2751 [Limisphaerales bacterium]|nr:MAG: hypothetical protein FD161_2751 [Limisphaerales bacterium]KAG0508249.1 MAG: hypothetical protein E1N63_2502 [Limisphaerales bacterium]TXT49564.1 MAG: hypothetical protein FD140_2890 [Limisphaerales bacterium]